MSKGDHGESFVTKEYINYGNMYKKANIKTLRSAKPGDHHLRLPRPGVIAGGGGAAGECGTGRDNEAGASE